MSPDQPVAAERHALYIAPVGGEGTDSRLGSTASVGIKGWRTGQRPRAVGQRSWRARSGVGNFGNGRIHAFDPASLNGQGEFQHRGPLHSADGSPIAIDGLWAIAFGSGAAANGPTNTLFFTAGPGDEQHGLFGTLVAAPSPDGH